MMDEERFRHRLRQLSVSIFIIGTILLSTGITTLLYVVRSTHETIHEQMKLEAQEYKNRIFKQFDKDFQILHTLASVIPLTHGELSNNIGEWIKRANIQDNDFVNIAFFNPEGKGVMDTFGVGLNTNFLLASCNDDIQEAVKQSFLGKDTISRLFVSEFSEERLYVYAVPVWRNGEVVGVLAASTRLNIFREIAGGNMVMNGHGYIHIIGSEGKFLLRSQYAAVPNKEYETIFDGPYIDKKHHGAILNVMEQQRSDFFEFTYNKEKYHFYLYPLGLNGWYLLCANTEWGHLHQVVSIIFTIAGGFLFVLLLSIALIVYGYIIIRKNGNNLIKIAYFDKVTGAENYIRFEQRFEEYVKHTKEYSIVAVNILNFKFFNELFGKKYADLILNELCKKIRSSIADNEFFCRENADQFYILIQDTDKVRIKNRMDDISSSMSEYSRKNKNGYDINIYCGVAIHGNPHQALLAQKFIRENTKERIHFYDEDIHKVELRNNYVESHMEHALENKEFKLYLQPKVRLADSSVSGAEALVRWQTNEGGLVYPGEFIPVFESNGFCGKLDLYMTECACKQIREWIDSGVPPIPISVNQTRLLFMDEDYVENLKQLLTKYQVPAKFIVLEILEGVMVNNLEKLNTKIEQLQSIGFKISLDDFGSGYSSLNTLHLLKLDELKIDQAFLRTASPKDGTKRWIVLKQIVQLAQQLKIVTVVEGIENREHAEMMKSFGCEYGQGYFYSRPLSAEEFSKKYMR